MDTQTENVYIRERDGQTDRKCVYKGKRYIDLIRCIIVCAHAHNHTHTHTAT